MRTSRRIVVALPLVALLGACGVAAARSGLASIEAKAGGMERLRVAVSLTPSDPGLHELLAIEEARIAATPDDSARAIAQAIDAVRLRPASAYAWAALAETRYRAGVADETFELALRRASELGPNEPLVQETVVLYGLAALPRLRAPGAAAVDRMMAAVAKRDPAAMLRMAERRGRLDAACRHVHALPRITEQLAQSCKGTEE